MKTITQEAMDRMKDYFPPGEDTEQGTGGNGSRFNLEGYLRDYAVEYRLEKKNGCSYYNLVNCLFNSSHKGAAIIQGKTGSLGYKCFHNSCGERTWKDARQKISGADSLKNYLPLEQAKEIPYSDIKSPQDILSRLETWKEIRELEISVEWVVDKIIPKNSVTLLYGRGGIGKTWLVMALARSIANGENFQGYSTVKTPVVYIDFENPISVLNFRTKMIGETEGVVFWRGNNEKLKAPKLDSKEWGVYKLLPPGSVLILDSLRSSQNKDENSSQEMGLVMDRVKELRDLGFIIIILHHTPKASDRVSKGSTAIVDLCDHIIGFHKVKKQKDGKEVLIDDDDDMEDALYRFGTGDKTRFEPFRFYLAFNPDHGFELAPDPQEERLKAMHGMLIKLGPMNKTAFAEACTGLGITKAKIYRMLNIGEGRYWDKTEDKKNNNRKIYTAKDLSGFLPIYNTGKPENPSDAFPGNEKSGYKNNRELIDKTKYSGFPDSVWIIEKGGDGEPTEKKYSDFEWITEQ